jgi:hypothetical protein
MRKPFSACVAFAAMLAAEGALAQAMVIPKEPPPPPPRGAGQEDSRAPRVRMVWVPGYYMWHRGRYFWVPGRCVVPPRRGAIWIPPKWNRDRGGYAFVEGRWR